MAELEASVINLLCLAKEPAFQTRIFLRETRNSGLCSHLLHEVPRLKLSLLQHLHLRVTETKSYLEMLLILSCLVVFSQKLQQSVLNLLVALSAGCSPAAHKTHWKSIFSL